MYVNVHLVHLGRTNDAHKENQGVKNNTYDMICPGCKKEKVTQGEDGWLCLSCGCHGHEPRIKPKASTGPVVRHVDCGRGTHSNKIDSLSEINEPISLLDLDPIW